MANNTVTSRPCRLFVQPQWDKIGKAYLSYYVYYASAYNRVETNQPLQDLISVQCDILCNYHSSVPIT